MKRLNMLAVLLLAGAAAAAPKAAPKADLAKGKEVAKSVCASCHAEDGNSSIAMYPKVAGQHASYVLTQTLDIKNKKRTSGASGMMAPMVQNLSESDIRNVAAYYAKQQAKPGEANPKENIELGRNIYRAGLPEKKVPACMSCHGPSGAGIPGGGTDITAYPRLGGQHSAYIGEQLKAYAAGQRTSANGMMETIAKRLNEEEVKAVGNFIQGLK